MSNYYRRATKEEYENAKGKRIEIQLSPSNSQYFVKNEPNPAIIWNEFFKAQDGLGLPSDPTYWIVHSLGMFGRGTIFAGNDLKETLRKLYLSLAQIMHRNSYTPDPLDPWLDLREGTDLIGAPEDVVRVAIVDLLGALYMKEWSAALHAIDTLCHVYGTSRAQVLG